MASSSGASSSRAPLARSPVSGAASSSALGFPFLTADGGLGAAMQEAVERSLPPTPRSPSPTCSPPSSPKRQAQKREDEQKAAASGELSAAEEDLETRAAALGLHEIERRVWRETALPPTPSSPSPTFSPPSSPKTNQRQAELALLTAEQAAVKVSHATGTQCALRLFSLPPHTFYLLACSQLAASLRSIRSGEGSRSCDSRCDSDSDAMAEAEVASAIAAWEAAGGGSTNSSGGHPCNNGGGGGGSGATSMSVVGDMGPPGSEMSSMSVSGGGGSSGGGGGGSGSSGGSGLMQAPPLVVGNSHRKKRQL